jgi:hypothetical protein
LQLIKHCHFKAVGILNLVEYFCNWIFQFNRNAFNDFWLTNFRPTAVCYLDSDHAPPAPLWNSAFYTRSFTVLVIKLLDSAAQMLQ